MGFITSKIANGNFYLVEIKSYSMPIDRVMCSQVALLILHKYAWLAWKVFIAPQKKSKGLINKNRYLKIAYAFSILNETE